MKIAYILRGLPGSGKSTLAHELAKTSSNSIIHCTDDYHMIDGKYKFQSERLGYFHQLNRDAFHDSCVAGTEVVICDNTNIRPHEWESYEKSARDNGYEVRFIIAGEFDVDICLSRNRHNVPYQVIIKMKKAFNL